MIHAREDYNRIQDPWERIPKNEPVFLFRAQDRWAWIVVLVYAVINYVVGNREVADTSFKWVERMREWPVKKEPDL